MTVFSQIKNFIKQNNNETNLKQQSFRKKHSRQKSRTHYNGLENYHIEKKLGDGAFSKVYQAINLNTREKVAIKVIHKLELNSKQKSRVLKEAQIMRSLKHSSVVKLIDFIESDEFYFLILELCEGGELFHQIVHLTYFSEDLSRHIIVQVANGIRYLHEERGVVHRDIKPENLLFTPIEIKKSKNPAPVSKFDEPKEDEGEFTPGVGGGGIGVVKIADFGLSKVIWDQETMTPCGTIGYTAPEIIKDQHYSKSVDMWALGCVLYTLLCGFPPFYDDSIRVLSEKVAKGQYSFLSPWWDHISFEAKDLISNLLCVNPEKRLTIMEFLDHPWIKNEKMETHFKVKTSKKNKIPSSLKETEAEAFKRMIQERDTKESELKTPLIGPNARANSVLSSSGPATPRPSSIKEAFDISYTVQRAQDEKKRKKINDLNTKRFSAFMNATVSPEYNFTLNKNCLPGSVNLNLKP